MKRRILFFLFSLALAGGVSSAAPVRSAHTEAELVSEVQSIQPGRPFTVGLYLRMDPHWHVYWRNPGDSGLAVDLAWELPPGFQAGPIEWPYPKRIDLEPLAVYAYENEVLLPVRIVPPEDLAPGQDAVLKARARWLACEVNCIPGEANLSLALPVRPGTPVPDRGWLPRFAGTRAHLPLKESPWNIEAFADGEQIVFRIKSGDEYDYPLTKIEFFPYDERLVDHAAPQKLARSGESYELRIRRSDLRKKPVDAVEGILVSREGWRGRGSEKSLEVSLSAKPLQGLAPAAPAETAGTGTALLFAFLGGILLNLMPCVFPVLSIKILGFVERAGHSRWRSGLHGAAFTAGVLVSFLALAGALLALRAAGEVIGWGFQLQSPAFIVVLTAVFFLLGLNLLGVFEVGASLTGVGRNAAGFQGMTGSFVSGVLAAVVATPCTAPFMGSALGFALVQPPAVSLAVFASLGFGMALPYLALSLMPELLTGLPRPGPWMVKLKKGMSLFLFLTAAWLVWILQQQAGRSVLAALAAGLALLAVTAWFYGKKQRQGGVPSRAGMLVLAGLLTGIAMPVLAAARQGAVPIMQEKGLLAWTSFAPEKLDRLVREGKPVFLDFTAAWCLTCHVNERVALEHPDVRAKFKEKGIVLMKADWTRRDPEITRALASYGRSSIPFYVFYPGGGREPVFLPELLTPGIVLETLQQTVTE